MVWPSPRCMRTTPRCRRAHRRCSAYRGLFGNRRRPFGPALRVEGRWDVRRFVEKSDGDQQHATFVALLAAVAAPSVDIRRSLTIGPARRQIPVLHRRSPSTGKSGTLLALDDVGSFIDQSRAQGFAGCGGGLAFPKWGVFGGPTNFHFMDAHALRFRNRVLSPRRRPLLPGRVRRSPRADAGPGAYSYSAWTSLHPFRHGLSSPCASCRLPRRNEMPSAPRWFYVWPDHHR